MTRGALGGLVLIAASACGSEASEIATTDRDAATGGTLAVDGGGGFPSGGSTSTDGSSTEGSAGSVPTGGMAGNVSAGGAGGVAPVTCVHYAPCSFPQGVPDEQFIASATSYTDTDPAVDQAVNLVMQTLTGCNAGSDCDIVGFPGTTVDEICQSWFAAVTQALRDQGFCAGQHAVGSTDEIAVSNTCCEDKWYGYHVCNYGGPKVVWNPGARRGWWRIEPTYCGP
jgi:hypothetical protein